MNYFTYICIMSEYLIYGLRCPKTDEYRYIGKSSSGLKRAKAHLTFSHNESVNHWVMELREQGLCPLIDVLEECCEDNLLVKEKFWIQFYESKGCRLMNSIIYKGSAIEKLQQDISEEQEKLNEMLQDLKSEVAELSEIHTFIRNRRKNLKITQEDLAELVQVSTKTIFQIEKGEGNPSYSTIMKILDVLGFTLVPRLKVMNR